MDDIRKLEYWLTYYDMPSENIKACVQQIQEGYGACRYLDGVVSGVEAVRNMQETTESPKFKVGDRIKPIDDCLGGPRTILKVNHSGYARDGYHYNGYYITNQGILEFEYEDNWERM